MAVDACFSKGIQKDELTDEDPEALRYVRGTNIAFTPPGRITVKSPKDFSPGATMTVAAGCTDKTTKVAPEVPEFPYQAILDSIENGDSPSIGGERTGMDPISNSIRYYLPSQKQKEDNFVDSLALYYNTRLAYNTAAYDVGTISRYFEDRDLQPFINSFDSINLNGISNPRLREALKHVSEEVAGELRHYNRIYHNIPARKAIDITGEQQYTLPFLLIENGCFYINTHRLIPKMGN